MDIFFYIFGINLFYNVQNATFCLKHHKKLPVGSVRIAQNIVQDYRHISPSKNELVSKPYDILTMFIPQCLSSLRHMYSLICISLKGRKPYIILLFICISLFALCVKHFKYYFQICLYHIKLIWQFYSSFTVNLYDLREKNHT